MPTTPSSLTSSTIVRSAYGACSPYYELPQRRIGGDRDRMNAEVDDAHGTRQLEDDANENANQMNRVIYAGQIRDYGGLLLP